MIKRARCLRGLQVGEAGWKVSMATEKCTLLAIEKCTLFGSSREGSEATGAGAPE